MQDFRISLDETNFDGSLDSYGLVFASDTTDNIIWRDPFAADVTLDIDGENVNLSEFIKGVREALGQSPVLLKCSHCGQWGAKFCACRYCGAPVG